MTLLQTATSATGAAGIPDYGVFGAYGISLLLLSIAVGVLWIRDNKKQTAHDTALAKKDTDYGSIIDKLQSKYELQIKDLTTKYELRLEEKDDDIKELNKDVRDMAVSAVSTISKFTEIQSRQR
jgi:hypothetical protein